MDMKGNLYYKRKSHTTKPVSNTVISDRKFLIDFIIKNYLGPDVNSDNPRCSSHQRLISGLQPYSLNDLGSSYVTVSLLEKLYYYLLRNALPNLILDLNMFHMYLKGNLYLPNSEFSEGSQQFTTVFPLELHQQIWYPDSFRIVKGVVLIDNPVLSSCVKEEDLNRFRLLTGVDSFKLDVSECLCVRIQPPLSDSDCVGKLSEESIPNEGCGLEKFRQECKRKYVDDGDTSSMPEFPHIVDGDPSSDKTCESDGPSMMSLIPIPDIDDYVQDSSVVLTGTAKRGILGPSVGVVDIGISKVAYLFRVSLPGVKREFSMFLLFLFNQVPFSSFFIIFDYLYWKWPFHVLYL